MIPAMKAAFLAIGSELLGIDRLDTNSLAATVLVERYGVEMRRKAVAGDSLADIERELTSMASQCDLVFVSGGLGPTADDVTREAVAKAFGRGTWEDADVVEGIRERFRQFGWKMPEVNRRQAMVIEGAELIANPRGTAPGQLLYADGAAIFLLPGVPNELEPMLRDFVEPWLEANTHGQVRETRVLKVAAVPESELEERIAPAYEEFGRENITILAKPGDITLRFTATGEKEIRQPRLSAMAGRLRELVGDAVYSDQDETLEAAVGRRLTELGATVSTAESCTGGLVAERLTRVAGSSAYFEGSVVVYSNRLKVALAGVCEETLTAHGAVSEPIAKELAEGVRERLGSDYGIGITGIAGPGGGSEAKPVGTVYVAVAGPKTTKVRKLFFPGDRERIRWFSSQIALEMLRRQLLGA